ncbi:hypothetical protein LOCC1_G006484 [Lachnellula occidentalis]|uniref:Uncharacterized protein n=1 Tax=Lachnellula occidentalis TaxID=215460 RepID=A0A8H8RPS4_9HELO|nr:hypothetical protein LOCC1_G006484 [Lachnellula occidentalis]
MPSLSSTYLIPALIFNPAFILHLINTFVSHFVPSPPTVSHSPHPVMEHLGPVQGTTLYMDMHDDDQLCWKYTAVMVVVQLFAFGRVSEKRGQRKARKAAARLEKERLKESSGKSEKDLRQINFQEECIAKSWDGTCESPENGALKLASENGHANHKAADGGNKSETESEASTTGTSEEGMNLV